MEEAEKQQGDIIVWWKRKYNYSATDERYLNATMEDIYSDYLQEKVADFNKEIGNNKYAVQIMQSKAKDKDFDSTQNKSLKEKLFDAFRKVKEQSPKTETELEKKDESGSEEEPNG